MRQLMTLAILAGIALAGWFYWPAIKAKFLSEQPDKGQPTQPKEDPASTSPSNPTSPSAVAGPSGAAGIPMPPPGTTVPPGATPPITTPPSGASPTPPPNPNAKPFRAEFGVELVTSGLTSHFEGT